METTNNNTKHIKEYKRKSDGQLVSFHDTTKKNGKTYDKHYHWEIPKDKRTNKKLKYKDRYGKECKVKSPESHLAPLDKDYDYK